MSKENIYNLQIGKEYWFRYNGTTPKMNWFKGKVTRFTDIGYPWVEAKDSYHSGIITDSYDMLPDSVEMQVKDAARNHLIKYGVVALATDEFFINLLTTFHLSQRQ